jgi:hypothetical protein
MTPYTAFLDYVMPDVPGCTNDVATHAIKQTVIDFCEKSLILQEDHDPVTLIRGVVDYDLDPPKDHLVSKIMKLYYKESALAPVATNDVASASLFNKFYAGAQPEEGPPRFYTQKDARTFSVFPYPKETEKLALTLRVALKPTRTASQCNDLIFEDYAEIIGHGAVSRLALSQNKPYFNPNLAGAKNVLYTAGLNMARQKANRGYVRSSSQVRMRKI